MKTIPSFFPFRNNGNNIWEYERETDIIRETLMRTTQEGNVI